MYHKEDSVLASFISGSLTIGCLCTSVKILCSSWCSKWSTPRTMTVISDDFFSQYLNSRHMPVVSFKVVCILAIDFVGLFHSRTCRRCPRSGMKYVCFFFIKCDTATHNIHTRQLKMRRETFQDS